MTTASEQEPIPLNKNKRIIKYRRDTEGHRVLPLELFFEDIDYDNTEFVEDEDAEPFDWNKAWPEHKDDAKTEIQEPSEEEKDAILQAILDRREALSEQYELIMLPAGTVIVINSEDLEQQPPSEHSIHPTATHPISNSRLAIPPRTKLKGKIALLQITSSPPNCDYDIEYNNIVSGCGLRYPSTVRCADVFAFPPKFKVSENDIKGTLIKDSETWRKIIYTFNKVPDKTIRIRNPYKSLKPSKGNGNNVIAYVIVKS